MKEYLPDFFVSFAFNNLNIKQKILPRLKPDLNIADVSHTNYKFSCDCNLTYIGESRLRLESRVNQHRTSKSSAIFQHIQTCTHYADSLHKNFSNQPSDSELRKHLFSHFKILTKNRYSAPSRKLSEGLFITKSQPELNRQVVHKKCLLFCSCLSDRIPPDKAVCNQSPWGLIRRYSYFQKFLEYVVLYKHRLFCTLSYPEDASKINAKHVGFFNQISVIMRKF